MKEKKLSKEEMNQLEEMALLGKKAFPGDMSKIEKALAARIDELPLPVEKKAPAKGKTALWIALALLIAIALSAYYMLNSHSNESPAIHYASAYYETPPFVISQETRGAEDVPTPLSKVYDAYKSKDFAKVLLYTENQNGAGLMFYRGIAQFELGQINAAITTLSQDNTIDLEDMRSWYLALGYLQSNDSQSAQLELEKIVNMPDHYKLREASDLLAKISK